MLPTHWRSESGRENRLYTVTVIGGGTGSFNVLAGLRTFDHLFVQSIVTMMDSGGDSGRLRDEFGVLPPGDLRRCLVALSDETQLMRDLFSFRFHEAPLQGRSFGNMLFLALTKVLGSEQEAIEAMGRILKIRGRVIAVTLDHSHLCSVLEDGTLVRTEADIDVPKHDPSIPIKKVFLEPEARANVEATRAIMDSDYIVFAPGNLFTSTVPNLLVRGIPQALEKSRARVIYILNLMTIFGETQGYSASRHVDQIVKYGGRVPDAVLVHRGRVPRALQTKYQAEEAHPVEIDTDELYFAGVQLVRFADVMSASSFVRHDPTRTAEALLDLFGDLADRKFQKE